MKPALKARRGAVFVVVAAGMAALAAAGALVVDIGMGVLARARLQNAADAAALAAAYHLLPEFDEAAARQAAAAWAAKNGATVKPEEITFGWRMDGRPWVEVKVRSQIPTSFARVFGTNTMDVGATSAVGLAAAAFPAGVMPFAVPAIPTPTGDWLVMTNENVYQPVTINGRKATDGPLIIRLKAGSGGEAKSDPLLGGLLGSATGAVSGNFQAIAIDGPGAKRYEDSIAEGSIRQLDYGTVVATEPGNMVGPTADAVNRRLARPIPDADIAYVPLIDATEWADIHGRSQVTLIGVIRVRLRPPDGNGVVTGEFLEGVVGAKPLLDGKPTKSPGMFVPTVIPPGQAKNLLP